MEMNNGSLGLLGPFFAETETHHQYQAQAQALNHVDQPKYEIWGPMKPRSVPSTPTHWNNGENGVPCHMGMDESFRRMYESKSASVGRFTDATGSNTSNSMYHLDPQPFFQDQDMLARPSHFPRQERALDFPEGTTAIEGNAPGQFDLTSGSYNEHNYASDFYQDASGRGDWAASHSSWPSEKDFYQTTPMDANHSFNSVGSHGSSNASLQSIQEACSPYPDERSLPGYQNGTLANYLQANSDGVDVAARFANDCPSSMPVVSLRHRKGNNMAELDAFSKKFGYSAKPREFLKYRPRRGKYRREF